LEAVAAGFEGHAEAAVEAFAEDATLQDRPGETVLRGREELLAHFMAYGGRRERFLPGRILVDLPHAAVEYAVVYRADAHAYGQRGVAVLTLAGAQIMDWRGVWVETEEDFSAWGGD
jgi:hypothetical protein